MKLSAYFIISLYVMSINFSLILTQNEMITDTDILPYKPPSIASEHETEIIPKSAKAHTYFKWGFLMWSTMSYLPENAISTHQNHWQSSKNVKDDYWEAIFSFSQKIDQILKSEYIGDYKREMTEGGYNIDEEIHELDYLYQAAMGEFK